MAARKETPSFGYDFQASSPPCPLTSGPEPAKAAAPPIGVNFLLDDDQAAAFFNCSKRTFGEFMDAPFMPRPIRLGPRMRRWSLDELRAAVAAMPREPARQAQPSALRAKVDALKGGGNGR